MNISVGILYSVKPLVKLLSTGAIKLVDFKEQFRTFYQANGEKLLDLAMKANWIMLNPDDSLVPTPLGLALISVEDDEKMLRDQLLHLVKNIELKWAVAIKNGRRELKSALSPDILQTFEEAGLFADQLDNELVSWWDEASIALRNADSSLRMETGREGERYSLEYETFRVGKRPEWIAIESNFAGYDLLSEREKGTLEPLLVEVKATKQRPREGRFVISKSEWETAMKSPFYVFHVWSTFSELKLFIITRDKISQHIPSNNNDGKWLNTEFSLKSFFDCEVDCTPVRNHFKPG